jgi:Chalcone isomerase-like
MGACVVQAQAVAANEPPAVAAPAVETRPEVKDALPQARLVGQGRLTVWGFQVYDARLWAPPGFGPNSYLRAPLALELSYLRAFSADEVAERSIKEIRRSVPVTDAQASRWIADMLRVLPDVQKGDRVLGVHQPGVGASFWVNGKSSGQVQDAEFARLFFGIWLSPNTSEPKLREALLAGAAG